MGDVVPFPRTWSQPPADLLACGECDEVWMVTAVCIDENRKVVGYAPERLVCSSCGTGIEL